MIVVCLVGLPASGKSSFAQLLQLELDSANLNPCIINFDEFLADAVREQHEFSTAAFHQSRRSALGQLRVLLQSSSSRALIIDDTMHLKSMRQEVAELCEQCR